MENKKIRILQIVGAPNGGIRKHIVDLINNLPNEEFDIGLLASLSDGDCKFTKDLESVTVKCKGRIYNLEITKKPSLNDLVNIYKLYKILKKDEYDILHGHGAKGGLYARIIGFLMKKKVVYTPHGGSMHNMFGFFKGKIYSYIEKFLYLLTHLIIVESNYSKDRYSKIVFNKSKKVKINYNGIDVSSKKKKLRVLSKDSEINICSFGLLRYIKGHDILIKSLKILINNGYKINLDIYGSGEEYNNLIKLIEENNLSNNIKICSEVSNVMEVMTQYDFLVHPSRFESFGYVPIEAMSVGLPVIATRVGGMLETIVDKKNGLLFTLNSEKELSDKIKLIINDNKLYNNLSKEGLKVVSEKYTLEKSILSLIKEYKFLY